MTRVLRSIMGAGVAGLLTLVAVAPAHAALAPAVAAPSVTVPSTRGWTELSSQVAVRKFGPIPRGLSITLSTDPVTVNNPVSLVVHFDSTLRIPRTAVLMGRSGTRLVRLDTETCRSCSTLTVTVPGSSVTAEQRFFTLRVGSTGWGVRVDGRESRTLTLDTRLQVTNSTSWFRTVKIGAGCIDPFGLIPLTLVPTQSTAVTGWCAVRSSDVQGSLLLGTVFTGYQVIDFYAGNPTIGYPWIEVDGVKHNFSVNEQCVFRAQGQILEASRAADLSGAKDLRLNWVDSSTLSAC